ncbi:MAG: hypothetical protein C0594_04420 [Marinilabiliales bacterium]|nr:MAG: hypothetical protein C0594_04420 [Marinilabiliales bacterium]
MDVDEQIIRGCMRYKRKSQQKLWDLYAPLMKSICFRYARDMDEASDILQEGFLKVFLNIKKYQWKGSFEGWMKRVMVNTAINYYKKNQSNYYFEQIDEERTNEQEVDEQYEEDNAVDKMHESDLKKDYNTVARAGFTEDELMAALKTIPDHFRIVFSMSVLDGYKHKEIAGMLLIDEKTSRTRLLRAKKLLKNQLFEMSIKKLVK